MRAERAADTADYLPVTAASSPVHRYAWASYVDERVVRVDSSTTKLYYHRNQQYSVVALTNASGSIVERYAYTAYGEPTILSGSGSPQSFATYKNRYQYTGREWDEKLELYHYRARMYSPVAGRFVRRDPAGYQDSTDLYLYVISNPLNLLDPSGLWSVTIRKHHWFKKYHRRPGHGQQVVSKFCGGLINIDDYTTPYSFGEHKWIHHPRPKHENYFGCIVSAAGYDEVYEAIVGNSKTCCDFLLQVYAAMMAYHTALQGAHGVGIIPGETTILNPFPPFPHEGPPSPLVLVPYRRAPTDTMPELLQKIEAVCPGDQQKRDQVIKDHYDQIFETLIDLTGIEDASSPGVEIPGAGVRLPVEVPKPIRIPLPAAR